MFHGFFIVGLAGATVVVSMFATQPASANKASEMAAILESCNSSTGQPQARIDACTRLIDSRYFTGDLLTNAFSFRSLSYIQLGQYERAIEDAGRAIARNPKEAGHFYARGTAYAQLKQFPRAIQDFDKAIALEPSEVNFNNRAYTYFQMGEFRRAIQDYDQTVALNPKSAGYRYMRGLAKLRSNDASGGNADIAAAVAIEPQVAEQYAAAGVTP